MKATVNIQDQFLNQLRKESIPVTVFLLNGFQLRGQVKGFDNFTVIVETEGRQQLVYKHAISTFAPQKNVQLKNEAEV
ncbi:RNA chaperone Hfq [Shouchella clausii]|jgi:host factor-I protein|uniref:RNA-binding protein Hfq n=3 Tax=Shouchella TaxID=2893057 RepID=HFQ_SHOC1|nr:MULTISPECIES: RNA chaperone Hfq [Shouchella]Q5WFY7.1 RecName: Full=RNA-binding protein Hfq [Shouchella clausii KSM-K16]MCM3312111.1 RNA chaperone Hfq [Psychrobacillus sp. MER TA 17]PAD44712.1 RNA-binding protein Hfq [Bacillus sp. 7520-S]SPU22520.1 RNA-binding protein Hfq [Niallia circulans]ALA54924.1 RNA-binding protein Hfq [Shouchella clausii]AST97595.1 RNA-binding protein Hfq [Shouchella clausii]